VLCIGGKIIGSALAMEVVKSGCRPTAGTSEEKYARRVAKVVEIASATSDRCESDLTMRINARARGGHPGRAGTGL
jgi:hypothetical protein